MSTFRCPTQKQQQQQRRRRRQPTRFVFGIRNLIISSILVIFCIRARGTAHTVITATSAPHTLVLAGIPYSDESDHIAI
jgi:hypothetical protein